jgi:hypothetical protein
MPVTIGISNECMPMLTQEELEQLNSILKRIRKHILDQMANVEIDDSP